MDETRMELTPFVTTDAQKTRARWADAPSYRRTKSRYARARSMWTKIGICLALLGAVVLAEVLIFGKEAPVVETASAGSSEDGGDEGDVLGRLRFVETGGVRSVFKVSQRWIAPAAASAFEKLEDDTVLCLTVAPGAAVNVCASGEVTAIGLSEEYGPYVRVSHGGDLESLYYNLTDIKVEVGQPLSTQDLIGSAASDGLVFVRILRAGAPVDPTDFIETGAA